MKFIGYAAIASVVLGIIAVATDDGKASANKEATTTTATPSAMSYTIADKKVSGQQMDLHLVIPSRTADTAALVEITRKLRAEAGWKEQLVCWFEIGAHYESGAWAACAYLPECAECETNKDADGVPVEFRLIGMRRSLADSLLPRHLDTIAGKQLVGAYLEDTWQCKTELYHIDGKPTKLLLSHLYNNGEHHLQWLTLKKVGGESRYYFDDNEPGDVHYILVDEGAKTVRYLDAEKGNEWQKNVFL